jgi:hypothetical protein
VNKLIEYLLDIDAISIGPRRVEDTQNNGKTKDENTTYIRDDDDNTDTAKSIRDLGYHLMQMQKTEQFDSDQ